MAHILPGHHEISALPRPVGGEEGPLTGLPLVPGGDVAAVPVDAAPGGQCAVGLDPDHGVDDVAQPPAAGADPFDD
jgi:hypothetical protein